MLILEKKIGMIQKETVLTIADNCGIKKVRCIGLFCGQYGKIARLGDYIKVTVREKDIHSKFLVGVNDQLFLAIVVRRKKITFRKSGHSLVFSTNSVILLGPENRIYGNRLRGPVCFDLRKTDNTKILTVAHRII